MMSVAVLAACQADGLEGTDGIRGSTPSPTATPIEIDPATAALEISATPIVQPTATDEPKRLSSEGSLATEGPWLLVYSGGSLYAFNSDGTGQTKLLDEYVLRFSTAPSGGLISYIIDVELENDKDGLQLKLFDMHDQSVRLLTSLQNPAVLPSIEEDEYGDAAFQAMRAIGSPRWSHDGTRFAFIGQIDGPSADLYMLSISNGEIIRLSDGPSQAYNPVWSPDDEFIFHNGVWNFGTGAGFNNAGSWAAKSDGSLMIETTGGIGTDSVVRWVEDHTFLMATWSQPCGSGRLRYVDLDSGSVDEIWAYAYDDLAYNENSGQLVLIVPPDWEFCSDDQPTGVYLFDHLTAQPEKVSEQEFWAVHVDPRNQEMFLLEDWDARLYQMGPSGEIDWIVDMPDNRPYFSLASGFWAWYSGWGEDTGLWLGGLDDPGPELIYTGEVNDGIWSLDGRSFFFLNEEVNGLFRAEAPEFEPELISDMIEMESFTYLMWLRQ
jgi:hypothetical protein